MRFPLSALLALPALLSVLVVAIPSPTFNDDGYPLVQTALERRPSWLKSVSDRLIERVWGVEKSLGSLDEVLKISGKTQRPLPASTLARYGGDVVVRFNVSTAEETRSLAEAADTLLLDVWEFSQDWVDIRLAKDIVPSLLGLLPGSLQNKHTPLLGDRSLAQAVHDTYPTPKNQPFTHATSPPPSHPRNRLLDPSQNNEGTAKTDFFFTDYQPLRVIEPWMRLLSVLYTTHVRMLSLGTSYEGRPIHALRVGVHPIPHPQKRKTVLITGGVHAREWISTSTVNYLAYSLITGYGKVPSITALLENFDFVFVPTLNPDGYAYTWETDRLWRKNRQRTNVRFCQGIDLDRGYGFEWDSVTTAGNPCSENFAGESAWEAVEAKALANWARNETERNNVEIVGFLDLHSYSQQILYPYSYSCEHTPPGQENLEELAVGLEKAIRVTNSISYEVLAACEGNVAVLKDGKKTLLPQIEAQGGSALDWFYHEMHVRYAYQIKLRDRGTYGFLLPKENIIPTGKEILGAVLYFGSFLQEQYVTGIKADEAVEKESPEVVAKEAVENNPTEAAGGQDAVVVEDVIQEELMEEIEWELRRRRKR